MEISMVKLIALIKALGGGGGGGGGGVSDVKVGGASVVSDGVANVPTSTTDATGTVQLSQISAIKAGSSNFTVVPLAYMDTAIFYRLAKAAGDSTQSASSNAVGTYTETAKSAISQMLSAPETVSGSTPSITAKPGVQYICGEVSTIDITVPESGIIDVIFESGSTPAVLTVTPPTGMTMKWAGGFDPTSLEANTVYEINIMNGCLGVGAAWT